MTIALSSALVRDLAGWLAGTDIALLELRTPDGMLRLRRCGGSDEGARPGKAAGPPLAVTSGSVGVFLHGHPQLAVPMARPGQPVRAGEPVGLLRIGALLLPVPAPADGVVAAVVADDGSTVGYGTELVRLHAS